MLHAAYASFSAEVEDGRSSITRTSNRSVASASLVSVAPRPTGRGEWSLGSWGGVPIIPPSTYRAPAPSTTRRSGSPWPARLRCGRPRHASPLQQTRPRLRHRVPHEEDRWRSQGCCASATSRHRRRRPDASRVPPSRRNRANFAVRMFVAIWPDEATRERLCALDLRNAGGLRMVRPDQWHITLRFLGEVTEVLTPAIFDSLEIAASTITSPINCEIGPATAWFSSSRVLQIPASGLDHLADVILQTTLPIIPDTKGRGSGFTGHLTLARSRRQTIDSADKNASAGIPVSAMFSVDYFDLVASELSTRGPNYTTLMRACLP